MIEAFETGIPGLRFFPDENRAQNEVRNMFFWVDSDGPFKDFDPTSVRDSSPIMAAPAEFVDTRSKILSWMMGVIYTEGFRGGRIIDDAGDTAEIKMLRAFELIASAGFEAANLTLENRNRQKYAIRIDESEFEKLHRLPFRRWNRVPGLPEAVNGNPVPAPNVDPYPDCADQHVAIDAKFDRSGGNEPGTNVKISVLENDVLGNGSQATFNKVRFDLDVDTPGFQQWIGTETYMLRINSSGQLHFKPSPEFNDESISLKYSVTEIATGLSDVVYARIVYDVQRTVAVLENDLLKLGEFLEIRLPEDSPRTTCKVFDMRDRFIDQFSVTVEDGFYSKTVDLDEGFYTLKVFLPEEVQILPFVIE